MAEKETIITKDLIAYNTVEAIIKMQNIISKTENSLIKEKKHKFILILIICVLFFVIWTLLTYFSILYLPLLISLIICVGCLMLFLLGYFLLKCSF